MIADQTAARPTHLSEIVRREPTHLGFYNSSGLEEGGVWIDPSFLGQYIVCRNPWLEYIIANLVSLMNK